MALCLRRCWYFYCIFLAAKCSSIWQRDVYTVTDGSRVTLRGFGLVMLVRLFTPTSLVGIRSFLIGWNNEGPDWWNL